MSTTARLAILACLATATAGAQEVSAFVAGGSEMLGSRYARVAYGTGASATLYLKRMRGGDSLSETDKRVGIRFSAVQMTGLSSDHSALYTGSVCCGNPPPSRRYASRVNVYQLAVLGAPIDRRSTRVELAAGAAVYHHGGIYGSDFGISGSVGVARRVVAGLWGSLAYERHARVVGIMVQDAPSPLFVPDMLRLGLTYDFSRRR